MWRSRPPEERVLRTGPYGDYESSKTRPKLLYPARARPAPRELCRHFGQDPSIADGIFLRIWRTGKRRNQPKIPPAVQTMLERGLVELRTTNRGPGPFFTETGWRRCGCSLRLERLRLIALLSQASRRTFLQTHEALVNDRLQRWPHGLAGRGQGVVTSEGHHEGVQAQVRAESNG